MDQAAVDTANDDSAPSPVTPARAPRRRARVGLDLTILAIVGVLLVAAVWATITTLYREFYSPTAFAERYTSLLAEGAAAQALEIPGVGVDAQTLAAADLPETASHALLRSATLTSLTDVQPVSETSEDGVYEVTLSYEAGGYPGKTTFRVESDGWTGLVPAWRFAESPLAVIDVTVAGSMSFAVNGFDLDKRQVSAAGVAALPLDPVPMLVFSPGVYRVSVDTAIAATAGVDVLADAPLANVPIDVQAEPTEAFISTVQDEVNAFLDACTAQQVLQPTACPFGYFVQNRIANLPAWTITSYPTIAVVPDGADWAVEPAEAVAHIDVDVRSLYDGTIRKVSEDVPFGLDASITILPDGSVSILVGSPAEDFDE